jgi:hypothetical protein
MMALKAAAFTVMTLLSAGGLAAQRTDTIIRTASRPVHAGVATLRRELSIGVVDGEDHYMLGAIADIAVSESGDIYVWDRIAPAIRMYNDAGKYVRTIGARGSGPGEYRAGAAIAIARNGNLLMWDPGNARINVYTAAGDVVTTWPTRSEGVGSVDGHGVLTVDATGTIYARKMFVLRQPGRPVDTRTGWIRFRPNGSLQDTVFVPPYPAERLLHAEAGGQFSSRTVPFMPDRNFELSPVGYFVSGISDRIALNIVEPGKPVVSIRRAVTPQPVTAKQRDSARAEITREMRKVLPSWSWNGSDIPRTKPVYTSLTIASDGRMWVQLDEGPAAKEDSTALGRGQMMVTERREAGLVRTSPWSCPSSGWMLFDVYEPTGTYLGQVRVPARVDPIVMRGDLIWAATCDADGVPSVGRYRILWR